MSVSSSVPSSVPSSLKKDVLLFTSKPVGNKGRMSTSNLGFRVKPLTETHVAQNKALWRAVRAGTLGEGDTEILKVRGSGVLAVPRSLFSWLMKYSWTEVSHAVLCILHDATCAAPNWQPNLPCPSQLAPSVAKALRKLSPHASHCKTGGTGGVPLVTRASSALDDLLQYLAGDSLWTVPVRVIGHGKEGEFVHKLKPQWRRWRETSGGGGEMAKRFMDVVKEGRLKDFWNEVETVTELGEVRDKEGKKKKTFLGKLPREIVTDYIIPGLFNE